MAEKVTLMILNLKVDLQCPCCYKKVKKFLCKFPEIRDQAYDEKQNLVKITVVCCNPEKIRDKLCCKGGKLIKSIEIVEPPKPKPEPKPEPQPKPNGGEPAPKPEPVIPPPPPAVGYCCVPCSEGYGGGPCYYVYGRPVPPPPCYNNYGYWYGYGQGCYVSRCDYFSEVNTGGCNIM